MSQGPTPGSGRAGVAEALAAATRQWQAGRLNEAEAILRNVLRRSPGHPGASHLLGIVLHQSGRTQEGIASIERALTAAPDSAAFHANIAKLHRANRNAKKAIEHGLRAVALKPDRADAHLDLGLACFDIGDLPQAVRHFDEALRLHPQLAEAANGRGNALRGLARLAEAEADYRQALALKPTYPEAHNNLGTVLLSLGRPAEAETAFRAALALRPNYVLAINNLVLALRELKKYDEAIAMAQHSLRLSPQNADALSYLGAVYVDLDKTELALDALRRSLALNPDKADTHNILGRALIEAGRTEEAVAAYRAAIALKPDFADPHNNLGNALKDVGDFSGALAAYDTALRLDPNHIGVYSNLVEVKKFALSADEHLRAMEVFAAKIDVLPDGDQVRLHFALGKAYDDLRRYDDAFNHLLKGNALHRKAVAYDESEMLGFFERIRIVFSPGLIQQKSGGGSASSLPIFVIGMPRSGTTLVEQIIASHPRVTGAGETRDLDEAVAGVRGGGGAPRPYPEVVPTLTAAEFTQIGEAYVARLKQRAPAAEHIVDKLPANYHFLGLIHLALPNAKIVHISRSGLDTCVSCFSKMFAVGQTHTYDLGELGRYYRAYDGLMAHWRRVLPPGAFLDVAYECLVGDIETEANRILAFCGLEWDARVLAFQSHERQVRTASAYQVRQPLYASAVGRWRNYEKFLGPLVHEIGTPDDLSGQRAVPLP